ncbi:MAG: selenocysteine-specific translation elongation factor [Proteobacteria bacterium]|nr:selenocysteine-specific translation elongation factor [Pseudomonadota bacterium]
MIVGTAGHIDHGKTTLVRALTGVDTDRLAEEKRRGISIELGYAFMAGPDGTRIGFVDVPGHERLVHTMLAGATGLDLALLLVAADDGVMPQTREHLAALVLLGLPRAIVALTKTDRVSPERLVEVQAQVQVLLADTPLAGSPMVPVSATTGVGLDALRARLLDAARSPTVRPLGAAFRLAIDRAFALPGAGTVVTGSVHAGRVQVGDELVLVPGGSRVRVRSVHAQNQATEAAEAGQRAALALVGVAHDAVARGQWVVAPEAALHTDRLDAWLTVWPGEARPLRSGAPVHVHLGAAAVMASVAVLEAGDALAPGASGWVQLVLRQPMGAWAGDRVVLRDAAASRMVAGGVVHDPHAPARYRRTPQRLSQLAALALPTPAARLAALLDASPNGLDAARLGAAHGAALAPPPDALAQDGWLLAARHADAAAALVLATLAAHHARQPDEPGPDAARLRRLALPRLAAPLWPALLAGLRGAGQVMVAGAFVQLPAHAVALSAAERRLAQQVAASLATAGFEGAWVRDLARDAGQPEALTRLTLARLAQRGELHQIVKDLYLPPATLQRLVALARDVAASQGGALTAARFRDATGLGRKRAIQVLEYFDRVGLTRRVGDAHRLRPQAGLLLG